MTHSDPSNPHDPMATRIFPDRESAEREYERLSGRGYSTNDINLVMHEETRKRYFGGDAEVTEVGNKALEGAGIGGGIGAATGGILGAILAATTVAIPGLGLFVAGPIAAALVGAGAGAVTGGTIGGLVGMGIPETRLKKYEKSLNQGGILMGVRPRNKEDRQYFEKEWDLEPEHETASTTTGTRRS